MALGVRRVSTYVHSEMLLRVLSSPVSFFDANPRGRILNRLSMDLDYMDTRLYLNTKICPQNILYTIAKLVIVGTQSPSVLAAGAVTAVLFAGTLVGVLAEAHISCCTCR